MLRSLARTLPFALLVVGCSNSEKPTTPVVDMAGLDFAPAPDLALPSRDPTDHPPLPQVTNVSGNGPVFSSIQVYTVVWPGDEMLGTQVEAFNGWLVGSDFWTQSLAEYGVGGGVSKGLLVMPTAAPPTIDDSAFDGLVQTVLGLLPSPPDPANTLFSFVLPSATMSTMMDFGGTAYGCQDYGGYHSQTSGTPSYSYAVNLQCPDPTTKPFDMLTEVLSHETAEAASDPQPNNAPAYNARGIATGGEIGDLCLGLTVPLQATVHVGDGGATPETYVVQRLYSEKVAMSGKSDPCVPAPSTPYFNVALNPSRVTLSLAAGSATTLVEPYAYGTVGNIHWKMAQVGTGITVNPRSGTAKAGDTIMVTFTTSAKAQTGRYPLILEASTDAGDTNIWFGSLRVGN